MRVHDGSILLELVFLVKIREYISREIKIYSVGLTVVRPVPVVMPAAAAAPVPGVVVHGVAPDADVEGSKAVHSLKHFL